MSPEEQIAELRVHVKALEERLNRFDKVDRFDIYKTVRHVGMKLGFYGVEPVEQAAFIATYGTPGAVYAQGDAIATKTAIDAIRQVLIDTGLIKSS